MSLKAHRDLEAKLHEQVYNNVFLLTLIYPPSAEFVKVFKKDMFVKNNKTAFQHVTYYLLDTLQPETLKQKISAWPIYDNRTEVQFRNEITKYLNELNSLYEDADLPTVMMSHLIAPGGYKFAKLMLKLSQLVVYEHLQKNSDVSANMMLRIKPTKDAKLTENNIKRLNEKTRRNNLVINNLKLESDRKLLRYQEKAADIMNKKIVINLELPLLQERCDSLKTNALQSHSPFSADDMDAREISLISKHTTVDRIHNKCKRLCDIITFLSSTNLYLDFSTNVTLADDVNLLHLMQEFNMSMGTRCFEIGTLSTSDLSQSIVKYSALNEELSRLSSSLNKVQTKLIKISLNLKRTSKPVQHRKLNNPLIVLQNTSDCEKDEKVDSTVLAVPLDISE